MVVEPKLWIRNASVTQDMATAPSCAKRSNKARWLAMARSMPSMATIFFVSLRDRRGRREATAFVVCGPRCGFSNDVIGDTG